MSLFVGVVTGAVVYWHVKHIQRRLDQQERVMMRLYKEIMRHQANKEDFEHTETVNGIRISMN